MAMHPRVAVLGAGVSGLSTAFFLACISRRGVPVTLIEASGRPGGWLCTEEHEGFVFERGCRGFRPKGINAPIVLQTIEDLGLAKQVELANAAAQLRFIYMNGKLEPVPTSPLGLFSSPLMNRILPSIWNDATSGRRLDTPADESVRAFISRRFSPEIADSLLDPMLSGVYAGDVAQLSVLSVFPFLKRMEVQHGSVIRGVARDMMRSSPAPPQPSPFAAAASKAASVSFKQGMSVFPRALLARLQASSHVSVRFNEAVVHLEPRLEGGVLVTSRGADGVEQTVPYETVVSSLPANVLSGVLPCTATGSVAAAVEHLRAIPRASVGVVNLGYRSDVLKGVKGFGYLIPSSQKQNVLGVVWDSCTFPGQGPPGETRITVMAGGAREPGIADVTPEHLTSRALTALHSHMGLSAEPAAVVSGVHVNCIPQPTVGHSARVAGARAGVGALFGGRLVLVGNSFDGIGAVDCVGNGARTATTVWNALAQVATV